MSLGTYKETGPTAHTWAHYSLTTDGSDDSGNSRSLGVTGGTPTFIAYGKFGTNCLNIDNDAEIMYKASTGLTFANGFTFGVWFKPAAEPANTAHQDIIDMRQAVNGHSIMNVWYTYATAGTHYQLAWRMGDNGINLSNLPTNLNPLTHTFHLIGVSFGATNFTLYIDGFPLQTGAIGTFNNGSGNADSIQLGNVEGYTNTGTNKFSEAFVSTDIKTDQWWRRYYAQAMGMLV